MKTKSLLAALAATGFTAGSASAGVIVGPLAPIAVAGNGVSQGPDITTGDLGGDDELVITYSVTRADLTGGDSWLTVTFNTGDSLFAFTGSGVFGGLLRTRTDTPAGHTAFQSVDTGGWSPNTTAVDFDAASPAEHAVRITVDGLSSGGFAGVKNITWEIDHNASSFATADRSYTGTIDFGGSDAGLEIDFHAINKEHSVNNLTATSVPEPRSLALMGLGGLLIARRRHG